MRKQGLGVVVVSHQLAAIFKVCDRIVVLRLGCNVGNFDAYSTSSDQIVTAITGKQLSDEAAHRVKIRAGKML